MTAQAHPIDIIDREYFKRKRIQKLMNHLDCNEEDAIKFSKHNYEGEYNTFSDFIIELTESSDFNLPQWLWIDMEETELELKSQGYFELPDDEPDTVHVYNLFFP